MISIAIDGPSGAGKSTISREVAKKLGFIYVDTGALYRAVGLHILRNDVVPTDAENVTALLDDINIELKYIVDEQRVFLNGEDVSTDIRTPNVSMAASDVSAIPAVRAFLFDLQRSMGEKYDIVMDGRDIGTVVLPNANVKIFLTASAEERARRRYDELYNKGMDIKYEDVLADIEKRDYNDSNRTAAPLRPADDSIYIDTTGNTLQQSIELLADTIKQRL